MVTIRTMVKQIPGARWCWRRLRRVGKVHDSRRNYRFERAPLDRVGDNADRSFVQIRNLLNYTKTNGTVYSGDKCQAGYHTIEICGQLLEGRRRPAERLKPVPVSFAGKTVLDIGSNQGGMLFQLPEVKWGVGIDYDPHMINVANRIKSFKRLMNLDFYVFDLEKDPLDLIEDFLPEPRVDVVFLLAVCGWLKNWREVISWCARRSSAMLFESTPGPTESQDSQIAYLRKIYGSNLVLLAERSEDDPYFKNRQLFYCGGNGIGAISKSSRPTATVVGPAP